MNTTWATHCLVLAVAIFMTSVVVWAGPPSLPSNQVLVPGLDSAPLTPRQAFGQECNQLCTGPRRFRCPIACRVSGFYSSKRNFGGLFDFSSRERDRAQSFDDKMFMELLGRKYDHM